MLTPTLGLLAVLVCFQRVLGASIYITPVAMYNFDFSTEASSIDLTASMASWTSYTCSSCSLSTSYHDYSYTYYKTHPANVSYNHWDSIYYAFQGIQSPNSEDYSVSSHAAFGATINYYAYSTSSYNFNNASTKFGKFVLTVTSTAGSEFVMFDISSTVKNAFADCYNSITASGLQTSSKTCNYDNMTVLNGTNTGGAYLYVNVRVEATRSASQSEILSIISAIVIPSISIVLMILNLMDLSLTGFFGRTCKSLSYDIFMNWGYMLFGGFAIMWVFIWIMISYCLCLFGFCLSPRLSRVIPYWFGPFHREIYISDEKPKDGECVRCLNDTAWGMFGVWMLMLLHGVWILICGCSLIGIPLIPQHLRCIRILTLLNKENIVVRRKIGGPLPGRDPFKPTHIPPLAQGPAVVMEVPVKTAGVQNPADAVAVNVDSPPQYVKPPVYEGERDVHPAAQPASTNQDASAPPQYD